MQLKQTKEIPTYHVSETKTNIEVVAELIINNCTKNSLEKFSEESSLRYGSNIDAFSFIQDITIVTEKTLFKRINSITYRTN